MSAGDSPSSLVCGTLSGGVHHWDLATRHDSQGYTRLDSRLEKACVWSVRPSPQVVMDYRRTETKNASYH